MTIRNRLVDVATSALLVATPATQAALLSGFETGLTGWEYMGDVSTQDARIGLAPTQGHNFAFVSTMCDRLNPPMLKYPSGESCETTINEHPYSGVSSPDAAYARAFLELPARPASAFLAVMPTVSQPSTAGESGALKTRFVVDQSALLTFDWNRIGSDSDSAYFSVWSADVGSTFRINNWLYAPPTYALPLTLSQVDLCSRYYSTTPVTCSGFNVETGWRTTAVRIDTPGTYWLGFALGEIAEGTGPTVLAIDNVRLAVPEPGSLALAAVALAAVAMCRQRPQDSHATSR